MKKVLLITAGIIILIAIITNPGHEKHKEEVKKEINTYLQKSISNSSDNTLAGSIGSAFGTMLGGAILNPIIDNCISSNNYILFSTTTITWEGNKNVIGVGVFGNIFLSRQLKDILNDYI